eukprot:375270-Pelagomonas_calceolata.AAC.11
MEEQQFPPCSAIVAHPATMLTLIRICGWLWLEACDIALEHGVHQASVCRLRAGKGKGAEQWEGVWQGTQERRFYLLQADVHDKCAHSAPDQHIFEHTDMQQEQAGTGRHAVR